MQNWKCVSDISTPLSRVDGDIACLSTNAKDCMWGSCKNGQVPALPNNIKPLKCGGDHKAKWGSTGYDVPSHWCAKGDKLIPAGPVLTPAPVQAPPPPPKVVAETGKGPLTPEVIPPPQQTTSTSSTSDYIFYIIDIIVSIIAISFALIITTDKDYTIRLTHLVLAIMFRYMYLGFLGLQWLNLI